VYFYDASGIRSAKYSYNREATTATPISEAVETQYYYMGRYLLFTADINGYKLTENIIDPYGNVVVSKRYEAITQQDIFGNEVVVGHNVGYYTINTDLRGSVTSIIRPDGSLATGYIYDEFGNQVKSGDLGFINEMTYTGAIYDAETNLVYMNARYYDTTAGIFISQDSYKGSMSSPQTQHLYSYTSNNPINFIDPTGHYAVSMNEEDKEVRYDITSNMKSIPKKKVIVPEVMIDGVIYSDFTNLINRALDRYLPRARYEHTKTWRFNYSWWIWVNQKGSEWDVKREDRWNKAIGCDTFPGVGVHVFYNGYLMTPEDLGNYVFGYVGHAVGLTFTELSAGSSKVANVKTLEEFENEMHDQKMIKLGFNDYSKR